MDKYEFLTEEWIKKCREMRDKHLNELTASGEIPKAPKVKINLIVTNAPGFSPEFNGNSSHDLNAHLDTTSGIIDIDLGHLDKADATIKTDFATAKSMIIENKFDKIIEAVQLGRISVKGNIFKLMPLASFKTDKFILAFIEKIRNITL